MPERPFDPLDAFEIRLARELRDVSEPALRQIDPVLVTRALAVAWPNRRVADRLGASFLRRVPWIAWIALVALMIAALGLALLAVGRRSPVLPGPGLLAYVQHPIGPGDFNDGDLYVSLPDGANARLLLSGVSGGASWSHSGRYLSVMRIAPQSDLLGTLLVLDPLSGRQVGTIDAGENADYQWSPVNDEIVVVGQARTGATMRIYRPDGTLVRSLVVPSGVTTIVDGIDWSPDGQRIVVSGCIGCQDSKYDDTPDLIWDLWIVEADGSGSTRLTDSPLEGEVRPAWSPDGTHIAYGIACLIDLPGCPDGPDGTWTIRPDGTDRRKVMAVGGDILWSPDGTRLLFERLVDGKPDVFEVDADGTHESRLTTDPGQDGPIEWSPDGSRILYTHIDPGDPLVDRPTEIWAMDSDGTHKTRLVTGSGDARWQGEP